MEFLLAALIEWLALNASMEINTAPEVVIMSSRELDEMYGAPVYALYAHHEGKIYLSSRVDLNTMQGKSVLLHELVHHYQNVSGAMDGYNCAEESEKLAYETQRDYLKAMKAKLLPELNAFNIIMRSLCVHLE